MLIEKENAARVLCDADDILLLTHAHPDGDTLGSAGALALALKAAGKRTAVVCGDKIAPKYMQFFACVPQQLNFEPNLIVAVDVADPKLLGNEMNAKYGDKVNICIDHHGSNVNYAEALWLDAGSAATAQMIYALLPEMGAGITPEMASLLFMGVSTDTGCFRFSNTTPETHRIAAELMELGAQSHEIIKIFFETKTKAYAALEKLCLNEMKIFLEGRCAVMPVTRSMFGKTGADDSDVEGLANLPRQIEGVKVGVTLKEQPDGTFKASVRTGGDVNASNICRRLGGGGHPGAAGCTLTATLNEAIHTLVNEVEKELKK